MIIAHHSCVLLSEDPAFKGCAHFYRPARSATFHFTFLIQFAFFCYKLWTTYFKFVLRFTFTEIK